MLETATLVLFAAALIVCVVLGQPILLGLAAGLAIFCAYALWKVRNPLDLLKMMLDGVKTAKGVLVIFVFIGMLTGLWRVSGTISALVTLAAGFFTPATLVLLTFVSCSAVSFLIGTSFGTAATMGVVCATIGQSTGVDPALIGGAVLSGCYFGDRCSPVSGSACLVAELTGTTVRQNIPRMLKSAFVPMLVCIALYLILGATGAADGTDLGSGAVTIAQGFNPHPAVYLPALVVLVLPLVCQNARLTLLVSSAIAFGLCVFVQNESPLTAAQTSIMGFDATDKSILLQGGGIVSMLYPGAVVCISSAYAGIFHGTGLLRGIQNQLDALSQRITRFGACLVTAIATSCIACNQTLAIMLTSQLCDELQKDKQAFAIELEDTAVLTAAAVPWSIASLVVLQVCGGAPTQSIAFAFFLFLVPLWHLGREVLSAWRQKRAESEARSATATSAVAPLAH